MSGPTEDWTPGAPEPIVPPNRLRVILFAVVCLVLIVAVVAVAVLPNRPPGPGPRPTPPPRGDAGAVIAGAAPRSWDPALAGDAATAATLAQVYEGLTAFDAQSRVQPALSDSWTVEDGGRRIVFDLRDGIRFSDGTPIGPDDVIESWLRLIDPQRPGPLASLLADVDGAAAYLRGQVGRDGVGLRADGDRVVVEFRRPAAYFVSVTASPSLAVLPTDAGDRRGADLPDGMVVSGGYMAAAQSDTTILLEGNPNYWAGMPAIADIEIITDTGGESPVGLFESGRVDWTNIGSLDASWISYDPDLGPQLRRTDAFATSYYGFDTRSPPFDDPLVRRALAQAVDWDRVVRLTDPESDPATSLLPAGIPGRGTDDLSVALDPDAAREALAQAGYPGGEDFPEVSLSGSGLPYDQAVAHELERELGIVVAVEVRPFDEYSALLDVDPPQFWGLTWIADYPHAHDFLGLLLESGSSSNEGGWSDAAFDAAIEAAAATEDPAQQERHYAEAQVILRDQAPLIPVAYGESWSLSRTGLLGAGESGVGFVRFAGLAWEGGR